MAKLKHKNSPRGFTPSYVKCSVCETQLPVARIVGRQKKKGHKKTMYCHQCEQEVDFVELKSIDSNPDIEAFQNEVADRRNQ